METVKAKIKGTNAILEGCVCDDSFFVSVDHDIFERYALCEVEICKDSLQVPETCKENTDSFTDDLEEEIEMQWHSFKKHLAEYGEESEVVVWLNWNNFNEVVKDAFIAGKELQKKHSFKPTQEQLNALDTVYKTHGADSACRHVILNLLNQLKEL